MKTEFVQPRFEGTRFSEHTLPLEIARDLAAYEALVVELAKHLYLKEHPERQRVPKGFAADFQLHLERVDDGCARPMLSWVSRGGLPLDGGANGYFERARDLIAHCIGAAGGSLPDDFPRNLLVHFNQVGRSLNGDERMELVAANGQVAVLTPERRKTLVLAADTVYERPIEIMGTIIEAHWERSSFTLRPKTGQPIVVPMPDGFHAQAREFGGRPRHQVVVKGLGAYDSWENLVRVVSVEALEVQPDYELTNRFDELRGLGDGWQDGHGKAPDRHQLNRVAAQMIGCYPEKLPLPAIVPTPEGNLLLEWNAPGDPSMDIDLGTLRGEFHVFQPHHEDIERAFDLSSGEDWRRLFAFVAQFTGQLAS